MAPRLLTRITSSLLLLWLFHSTSTTALFFRGSSPQIHSPLSNPLPTICPVAQDGSTSDTFPWTHNPTCVSLVLPSSSEHHLGVHQDYCVYTNTAFNNGRGISLVATPETATELTYETFKEYVEADEKGEGKGMWEMKDTDGKGKGLFATRRIKAGESLILKSPVLFVSREALSTPSRKRRSLLLETAASQLPESTRKMVMGLARRGGDGEIEDVLNTNGIRAKVWDGTSTLALVPEAARINHACRPNAFYRFDDYTLDFNVFSLKDIKPGEEITFSYGFSNEPHAARQEHLKTHWGFTCTCPLCTANSTTISASDARLKQIADLKAVLPTDHGDIPQFLGLLPDLLALLEAEDLIVEQPMYEEILAYTWSSFGIEDRAKYWARRARKHWEVIAGVESWEARRTGELEGDIKGHGTWMTWEGDPWEGVGEGHPWGEEGHDHDH